MTQEHIFSEIHSAFAKPMRNSLNFRFVMLQPTGGTSMKLTIPSLSSSFEWTASSDAGKHAKTPVYIMAEDALEVRYLHATLSPHMFNLCFKLFC